MPAFDGRSVDFPMTGIINPVLDTMGQWFTIKVRRAQGYSTPLTTHQPAPAHHFRIDVGIAPAIS
jgi:hypothetical protein